MQIVSFTPKENFTPSHRKEKSMFEAYKIVTYDPMDGFKEPLELRIYDTKRNHYACVWLNGKKFNALGSASQGYNGSFGDTVIEALENAGFTIDYDMQSNSTSIEKILNAIANHLGLEAYTIVKCHA